MHQKISPRLQHVTNLQEIEAVILSLLEEHRQAHHRIGYVSGVITADGWDAMPANLERLSQHTEQLRQAHDFPIFAPTDIFTDQVYDQIAVHTVPSDDFKQFWRNVLNSGYVTDIFMTPRWEVSGGARDELEIAEKLGLTIHYIS